MALIELVIYTAIIGFLLLAMVSFILNAVQLRTKGKAAEEIAYNARVIQDRLQDAARHATAVQVASSVFDVDPGVLSFAMAAAQEDPTVFSLDADDGAFHVSIDGVGAALTTDRVSVENLVFTDVTGPNDAGLVRVNFTLMMENGVSPYFSYEESFQTTLRLSITP